MPNNTTVNRKHDGLVHPVGDYGTKSEGKGENLPPTVRFFVEKFWRTSTKAKVFIIVGVVLFQVLFYQFYIKHTLENPSIQYKRKRFYDHHLDGLDGSLTKEQTITDDSPSHYVIAAHIDKNNENEYQKFQFVKCVAEYLKKKTDKITFEVKSFETYDEYKHYIISHYSEQPGVVNSLKLWWKKQYIPSPNIFLSKESKTQDLGSMKDFLKRIHKFHGHLLPKLDYLLAECKNFDS